MYDPDGSPNLAGIWDDVYSNRDGGHSYIPDGWEDGQGNGVQGLPQSIMHCKGGDPLKIGATVTSQSTSGMGHDRVNHYDPMSHMESFRYFANVLVSGPAHVSYLSRSEERAADRYHALQPIFYNSVGHSGSETDALAKMLIAGGFLTPELKLQLKTHGLYASFLLYLWKSCLPYDVPYAHELRHRVAYFSLGDGSHHKATSGENPLLLAHRYDDSAHMRSMVLQARNLVSPPPEVVFTILEHEGCEVEYFLKKCVLIKRKPFQTVKLRITLEDSYDLEGRDLSFDWSVLCGNRKTRIEHVGPGPVFDIEVPPDRRLPQGRTSILAVADNGLTQGNPAILNIYRADGKPNQRPSFDGLVDRTVLPGEAVRMPIRSVDPEGFPVRFSKWNGSGRMDGNVFTWDCPPDWAPGTVPVTVVASDGTAGNSYRAGQSTIRVSPVVAQMGVSAVRGRVPLEVSFSSEGSRDVTGEDVSVVWDFGDGSRSEESSPVHRFEVPGSYRVTLTAYGPSGSDATEQVVDVLEPSSEGKRSLPEKPVVHLFQEAVEIEANGFLIENGETKPCAWERTHFPRSGTTRTYLLHNRTAKTLALGYRSVRLEGEDAGDFRVLDFPRSTVEVNGSTVFTLSFDPAGQGERSARVVVNLPDGSPYAFAVQGMGTD